MQSIDDKALSKVRNSSVIQAITGEQQIHPMSYPHQLNWLTDAIGRTAKIDSAYRFFFQHMHTPLMMVSKASINPGGWCSKKTKMRNTVAIAVDIAGALSK